ncbi:alpha/beta hydrolase [Allobranchiibius sp. GilTou38]|nr:alpha/beta hydrolase [Allobranchiibius sp. GilTou38]
MAALASDVLGLMAHLELRDVTLVGHDWGARAAHACAALRPSALSGLVTLSTAYGAAGRAGRPASDPQRLRPGLPRWWWPGCGGSQ